MNGPSPANHKTSGISTYPFYIFGNGREQLAPQAGELPDFAPTPCWLALD